MDKINDEAYTYPCRALPGSSEEGLMGQLVKLKGKIDTSCIMCLHELVDLMAKDEEIGKFFYTMTP